MARASMMYVALLVLHGLLGALCLTVARGGKKSAALRYWGWGLLVYSVGILVNIVPLIPSGAQRVIGNSMVGIAAILSSGAILQHSEFRLRKGWVWFGWALTVVALLANHARSHPSWTFDMLAPSPFPNILFLLAAYGLLRKSPQVPKAPARTLAGFLIFAVVLWTARLWSVTVAIAGSNDPTRADFTISVFAIGQMVAVVGATVGLFWIAARSLAAELHRLAGIDELTGLPNRRATVLRFDEEAARAIRHQRPYSIVVLDIDHFKRVNDTYGHAIGDDVLKNVARTLDVSKRGVDVVGRIGGEEFVVILSEESSDGAKIGAERLRSRIAESSPLRETAGIKLTVSGGIATAPEDGQSWDELFAVADKRLYEAKRAGRNRVIGRPADPVGAAPSLAVLLA